MKASLRYLVLVLVSGLTFFFVAPIDARAAGPIPRADTYAAIGDSYAAGTFLAPGQQSYPHLIAGASGGVTMMADSGLKLSDAVNLLAANPNVYPGFKWVTVTIGANDTDWSTLLLGCLQAGTSCNYVQVLQTLNQRVDALTPKLPGLISQIHRVFPNATIYWSGYVRPFGPSSLKQTCNVSVDGYGDVGVPAIVGAAIDATVVNLNARIAGAVLVQRLRRLPVSYVAVDPYFSGHRYCNVDAWFNTLHPNFEGQMAYAKAFERAGMPTG